MHEIIEGDCLQKMRDMATGSFDCMITDPPYGMSINLTHRAKPLATFANEDLTPEEHTAWFTEFLQESARVLKERTFVMIWIDYRNYARIYPLVAKHFEIKNCIVWDKGHFGAGNNFRFQHELCIFAVRGGYALDRHDVADVWKVKREGYSEQMHMTQKPLELMKMCIEYTGADNILDPFAGSGTTIVAAKEMGRSATGIELAPENVAIAQGRLSQGNLF